MGRLEENSAISLKPRFVLPMSRTTPPKTLHAMPRTLSTALTVDSAAKCGHNQKVSVKLHVRLTAAVACLVCHILRIANTTRRIGILRRDVSYNYSGGKQAHRTRVKCGMRDGECGWRCGEWIQSLIMMNKPNSKPSYGYSVMGRV